MKMTRVFRKSFAVLLIISCSACSNAIKDEKKPDPEKPLTNSESGGYKYPWMYHGKKAWYTRETKVMTLNDLYGYWVGRFEPDTALDALYSGEQQVWDYSNKINLCIDSISGDSIYGHSVVAGNLRPFKGTFSNHYQQYAFKLSEPGDDKYDGAFTCSTAADGAQIQGIWTSYKKLKISKRKYVLTKRFFEYNPGIKLNEGNAYIDWNKKKKSGKSYDDGEESDYMDAYFTTTEDVFNYNASSTLLKAKDIENLTKADLFIIRNSIYARHGYSFKNRQLRAYFDSEDWYIPLYTDVKDELTETEKQNIKLLMRYEKNAEEYYDEFGRG